jgi:precorrin-3B methylase
VAPAAAPVQAGPEQGGGGQEEEILALAQATVGGDQAAAAQLGAMLVHDFARSSSWRWWR